MKCETCAISFSPKDKSPSHLARRTPRFCCLNCAHIGHRQHNKSLAPIFRIWSDMKRRCSNPNRGDYKYYGGRGIKVCKRWLVFKNFLKDMGEPKIGETIDRINNSKGYSPKNCKWATRLEQMNNTRFNRLITFSGKTMSVSSWARTIGLHPDTLKRRLYLGWSENKALTQPKKVKQLS